MRKQKLDRGAGQCRNLNYWDSVSTLAGEVPNPAKTFPKALFGAVLLVVVTYVVPLFVGLGVTTDISDWKLGYFASLAKQVQYAIFTVTVIDIIITILQYDLWLCAATYNLSAHGYRMYCANIMLGAQHDMCCMRCYRS